MWFIFFTSLCTFRWITALIDLRQAYGAQWTKADRTLLVDQMWPEKRGFFGYRNFCVSLLFTRNIFVSGKLADVRRKWQVSNCCWHSFSTWPRVALTSNFFSLLLMKFWFALFGEFSLMNFGWKLFSWNGEKFRSAALLYTAIDVEESDKYSRKNIAHILMQSVQNDFKRLCCFYRGEGWWLFSSSCCCARQL